MNGEDVELKKFLIPAVFFAFQKNSKIRPAVEVQDD